MMFSPSFSCKGIIATALSVVTAISTSAPLRGEESAERHTASPSVVEHQLNGKMDFVASDGTPLPDLRGLAERTLGIPPTGQGTQRLVGSDNRTQVTVTTKSPWAPLCYLEITAGNGQLYRASGVLIGSKTVLTNGITVYNKNTGGWARQMKVYPGRNGTTSPYGSANAVTFKTFTGWTQNSNTSDNIGAILLDSPIGNKAGWYGVKAATDSYLQNHSSELYAYGYPAEKTPDKSLWGMKGNLTGFADAGKQIQVNLDVTGGQFGCPLFVDTAFDNGIPIVDPGWAPAVVGVMCAESTSSSSPFNVAARITSSNFSTIKGWIQ